MGSPLDHLLEEGVITEVVGRLQSGKEAEVFIVRYAERVVAAKVYKDRAQRSFKNNAAYKEGRAVRNTRDQRAMDRRSRFGQATEEETWKSAEADALYRLHAAGVRVPEPVLFFEGVLLMELVLDADGVTARRLIDTELSAEQANAAYHDMLTQLVRMLACDLIHGDLSPYNTLWAAGGVTIIDFPQIVSAAQNSNSERFFLRDAENILGHFRSMDRRLEGRRGDAAEIWRAYMRRELSADFVPTGRLRLPPPQRPIPIAARPADNAHRGPVPPPHRGNGQSPLRANGQPHRGSGQPLRADGPPHRGSGQQPRANGQPHRGSGQQPRTNGQPHRGSGQQPRTNGQPHRGSGAAASPPRSRPSGSGSSRGRRAMPEVIVRPRAATQEPKTAAPTEAVARAEPDFGTAKRRR
jgi:RIO kinase 1